MDVIHGISVVVATKGRVRLLEELLESVFAARKKYEKKSEIILVDDSNEKEQDDIEKLCQKYDAVLEKYTNSVAMKRDHGVKVAKYELILFLDSDCKPVPDILNLHEQCYVSEKIGAAAGPLEFVGEENWFWKCVTLTPYLICFKMPYWGEEIPWGATANFSVRKAVYEKVGGFSSDFPNKPGGEDVDFGIMITKAGYVIKSAPKAIVYHAKETWSKVIPMYKRAWHYGSADYYLVDRHQDMCCKAVPHRTIISFAVDLTCIICAILKSPWILIGAVLWNVLDIVIMAVIMSGTGFQKSKVSKQIVVQTIIVINELGYITNCIRHLKPGYIGQQIVYFENQVKGNLTNAHATFWRTIICYIILICSILLFQVCGLF